jgi:hypothetical protein
MINGPTILNLTSTLHIKGLNFPMSVILLCLSLVTYIGILRCPRNLSHHMDRQASNGDTVLVKSREMTGRAQTLPWWLEGERVKTTENKMHWSRC